MTKAVIFDLDETLLDRESSIKPYIRGLYDRYAPQNHLYTDFYQRFYTLDNHGYHDKQQLFSTLMAEFNLTTTYEELMVDFRQRCWRSCILFPDAESVLQELRTNGYKLGIITNGSVESQQAQILASGLTDFVDTILISAQEGIRKPDPAIFLRATERLQVEPSACLFTGDNPHADIQGANAVGMKTAWYERHLPWPEEVTHCYDFKLNCLADILTLAW